MKITKSIINELLSNYSVHKNDFIHYSTDNSSFYFKHKTLKGYHIIIKPELQYHTETGRIQVIHTKPSGEITVIDTWEKSGNSYSFLLRDTPASLKKQPDFEYVKELRTIIEELKIANSKYGRPKTPPEIVDKIKADIELGESKSAIARKYNLSRKTVYNILK